MRRRLVFLSCGIDDPYRCGNVGKLTRIANVVSDASFASAYPRKDPQAPFLVLGGFADFLVPSSYVNAHGAIIGLGNVAPVSVHLLRLLPRINAMCPIAGDCEALCAYGSIETRCNSASRSATIARNHCACRLYDCEDVDCRNEISFREVVWVRWSSTETSCWD